MSRFLHGNPGSEPRPDKRATALRQAFQHEVRPGDYMGRVIMTAMLVAGYLIFQDIYIDGHWQILNILPLDGWQARDPRGALYVESWTTIITNGFQVGFTVWGAILLALGIIRIVAKHRYVFACFSLGLGFVGIALALPRCVVPLLQLAVERFPVLVN